MSGPNSSRVLSSQEFGRGEFFFNETILASSRQDKTFVALGLGTALVLRPLLSGTSHLLYCQSQKDYVIWWGVDYVSICLAVLGASLVFGRFTFYCSPQQETFFIISIVGLFSSTIISVLFIASAGVRTGSFLLYVVFAIGIPFLYQFSLKFDGAAENDVPREYLILWAVNLSTVGLGLLVKVTSFPEVLFPGKCDIFFASHQWWHILINTGNAIGFWVWLTYLEWRHQTPCG